jgi:beta-lactamase regulating signal transducer with metallopeptidase domain
MTILERLHDIGFTSAAGVGGELLLKATVVLAAALVLDFLLHRRLLLTCSATWNGTLVLLALLPIACLILPAKRVASTPSVAAKGTTVTEPSPAMTQSPVTIAPTSPSPSLQDATIGLPFDDVIEEPAATQISTKPPAQVATAPSAPAPSPVLHWATLLTWSAAAQPWFVPGLVAVYLTGVAAFVLRLLASLMAVTRLQRRTQAVTADDWQQRLAVWRTRCGLRRAVELRHGGDVMVPIVIGFRRPAIIVPTDLLESTSGAKRDAILAHELAHIVRGDCRWQLLERVVGAVLWFHPLVWYAGRRIGLVRERICDGFAVHHLGRRNEYVETLLEMATRLTSRRGLSLGLAVLRTSQLGARLASVQNAKSLQRCQVRPTARWAILILTAAAAIWAGRAAVAVEPVPQVAGLPSDAQALVAGYEQKSARLQADVDRQVAAERDALIRSLQSLQDEYTRQAKLDEAVAIRDQLRLIKAPETPRGKPAIRPPVGMPGAYPGISRPPSFPQYPGLPRTSDKYMPVAAPNPLSMVPYRKSPGKVLLIEVSGTTSGTVWGDSEVCTDDSSLGAAAVQFGALKPGEHGMIKVTTEPGKPNYPGFSRNGVTSLAWDNRGGAYSSLKIEAAPAGSYSACHPRNGETPGVTVYTIEDQNIVTLANFVGYTFVFETTGQVNSNLWGTDDYTHDSSLGAAAIHAGVLQAGQTGYVVMEVKPGIPFYRGSTRHGVTSSDWKNAGNYVTLTFQTPGAVGQEIEYGDLFGYRPIEAVRVRPASEASSDLFRRSVGQTFYFNVTGANDGYLWGTNPYTDDSSLAAAAIHAGILEPGEQGIIRVHVEPPLDSYPGSTQHGVTSQAWNAGGGYVALRLSRVPVRRANNYAQPGVGGPTTSVRRRVLPDPGNLTNYAQSVGQSFYFRVTGSTSGPIWGTDVYTHDSALAAAAVHAGVLQPGESGVVKVTMLPALPQYHGSTNNGVTSGQWDNDGSYVSYQVERADTLRRRGPIMRGRGTIQGDGIIERKYEILDRRGLAPAAAPPDGPSNTTSLLRDTKAAPPGEAPSGAPLGNNTWSNQVEEATAPQDAPPSGSTNGPTGPSTPGGPPAGGIAPSTAPAASPAPAVSAGQPPSSDAAPPGGSGVPSATPRTSSAPGAPSSQPPSSDSAPHVGEPPK